jgi:hypothetical protein
MKNRLILLFTIIVSASILAGFTITGSHQNDEPIELHTIMRLLIQDVHTIYEGIFTQNFDLIEAGATAINSHAPLSDETMALIKETLGDQMPVFIGYDKIVHSYADSIRYAAQHENMNRVLSHFQTMERGCIACHAAFQDTLRIARLTSG